MTSDDDILRLYDDGLPLRDIGRLLHVGSKRIDAAIRTGQRPRRPKGKPARSLSERIWERVEKTEGCWLWRGTLKRGYGVIAIRHQTSRLVHRLIYEMEVGPIPEGMGVLHDCDTPACVRPDHLFLGTQVDNTRDMDRKGRGRRHFESTRKLTLEQVEEILTSDESSRVLAERYPVNARHIRRVRRYAATGSWK